MLTSEFLTVVIVSLLALMSPGPDFVMISRNSLVYSRKVGVYSSIGLGFGILVHVAYSLVGIGLIISKSIVLFSILKFLGAGYLFYIGYSCLRSQPRTLQSEEETKQKAISTWTAIRMGFLTNVLNPKATLFFFALFTQVINPHTPKGVQIFYGLVVSVMTMGWFSFVAEVLSHHAIKSRFMSVIHYLERTFGVILIALGIKVAFSTQR